MAPLSPNFRDCYHVTFVVDKSSYQGPLACNYN